MYTLKAPKDQMFISCLKLTLAVENDGTVRVPGFLVKDLLATGCTYVDTPLIIDATNELENAAPGELAIFFLSRGINPVQLQVPTPRRSSKSVDPKTKKIVETKLPDKQPVTFETLLQAALVLYDAEQE